MRPPTLAAVIVPFPFVDPLRAYAAARGTGGMSVLLNSAAPGPDTGRYCVVAANPVTVLREGWRQAFSRLNALWRTLPHVAPNAWPIGPGLFGSLGYELRRALEDVPGRQPPCDLPPDLWLGLFDTVAVFDLTLGRAAVIACDLDPNRGDAAARAERLANAIAHASELPALDWTAEEPWVADWSEAGYAGQVERALDYIRAGDIYQANFTQRWVARRPKGIDPFMLYRRLSALSPAPYAALIEDGGHALISASPERFLRLTPDGKIDTRPIKGTRPRALDRAVDAAQAAALSASGKDRAENLMIVDLLRNDLGRVAVTGSVAVPELNALHSFASVHHLVSTVTARLRPGLDALDLIRAAFPGGSVTGAPKIRAMQIIDELEAARRGPYCGAIGWLGLNGGMELSIAIRTLTVTLDAIIAQAGGGIVADSDPGAEYREALTKAGPMLATLKQDFR